MKRTKEDDTKPVDEALEIVIYHQKKTNISKSTAPWVMKLDGGLDHMYTKVRKFWAQAV